MSGDYRMFGLSVRSDLDLPELCRAERGGTAPDVTIRLGAVPESLPGGRSIGEVMEVTPETCRFRFDGIGDFLIERGGAITVSPGAGVEMRDLRAFLYGTVTGTLLHQRGLFPLHVSAVAGPDGAIALTGESGAGKSTLAAAIRANTGRRLVTDDVAVARMAGDVPTICGGVMRQKLWRDALDGLGLWSDDLARDLTRADKYHLGAAEAFSPGDHEFRHLVALAEGPETVLEETSGATAFTVVMNAIYRPYLISFFGDPAAAAEMAARLASRVRVWTLKRPWTREGLAASAELLESSLF